jgi:hypothetical protein
MRGYSVVGKDQGKRGEYHRNKGFPQVRKIVFIPLIHHNANEEKIMRILLSFAWLA